MIWAGKKSWLLLEFFGVWLGVAAMISQVRFARTPRGGVCTHRYWPTGSKRGAPGAGDAATGTVIGLLMIGLRKILEAG
jgi:hypothetical protein